MKKMFLATAVALSFAFAPGNTRAQEVSFQVFFSSLSPYGEWVNLGAYGMCWRPVGMPLGWMPYTYGHWVWTDYGWTWVSDEAWGWAPFHYGRWVYDDFYGWVWVPGYVWAPAWVEWRWGGGYCGWAPLPPGFHFRVDVVVGPDYRDFGVRSRGWVFVNAREMGEPRYRFVDRDAVPRIMVRTQNVTRFRFTAGGVYQVGLSRDEVERVARRRIATVAVVRTNELGRARIQGNELHIYSPAPFQPRVRDEERVIVRERALQHPERLRQDNRDINRPRQEASQPARVRQQSEPPRMRQGREAPRVERSRPGEMRPARETPAKPKDQPRERAGNEKDKGPHRHR